MSVRIVDKLPEFNIKNKKKMNIALNSVANDILALSKMRVPIKTGKLIGTGRTKSISSLQKQIIYGWGGRVDYAGYQERGMRKDGTRVVRKYTSPGTGKDYLKEAGDHIGNNFTRYVTKFGI